MKLISIKSKQQKVAVKIRCEHWPVAHETIKKNYEGRPRSGQIQLELAAQVGDQWLKTDAILLAVVLRGGFSFHTLYIHTAPIRNS